MPFSVYRTLVPMVLVINIYSQDICLKLALAKCNFTVINSYDVKGIIFINKLRNYDFITFYFPTIWENPR